MIAQLSTGTAPCRTHLSYLLTPAGQITEIGVHGQIDLSNTICSGPRCSKPIDKLLTHLIVDVAGVSLCSARGAALLADPDGTSVRGRRWYALSGVPVIIDRILTLMGPAATLPVRHSTAQAAAIVALADQHDRLRRERAAAATRSTARMALRVVPDANRSRNTVTDVELTALARDGDSVAYRELAHRHRTRMYRRALEILGSSDDLDDLTDDLGQRLRTALAAFAGPALADTRPGGPVNLTV